jgi:hypothetical protein
MMMGIKIPAVVALAATFGLLAGGIGYSLFKTREVKLQGN